MKKNPRNAANRKIGQILRRPAFRKKKFRTQRARFAAAWAIARKEGWPGHPGTKKSSSKKKKSSGRRMSYQSFLQKVGGRGYSRSDKSRMWKRYKEGAKLPKLRAKKKAKSSSKRRRVSASRPRPQSGLSWLADQEKKIAADVKKRKAAAARKAARTRKHNQAIMRKLQAQGYSNQQIAMMKKHQASKWGFKTAKNNPNFSLGGLALSNGLALDNPAIPLGDLLSPSFYLDTARDQILPVLGGAAIGGAAHALASSMGVTTKIVDTLDNLPVLGPVLGEWQIPVVDQSVTELLPYSIQGSAVFLATGVAAALAPAGIVRNLLLTTGASALAFGGGIDAFNFVSARRAGVSDGELMAALEAEGADMSGLALSGLALDNQSALGGLALDNTSALGGLALDNFGDGFAYQTAPLQAAGADDYGQACMADAYYSGADFSGDEGQALLNGREAFLNTYGAAPYRPKGDPSNASHLAGRAGHRWGWLIRTVGWEKARQIAALPPKKRLAVIKSMRQNALQAYQREMLAQRVQSVEATPASPELVPAAGSVAGGASAPGGPTGAFGDPALFMS